MKIILSSELSRIFQTDVRNSISVSVHWRFLLTNLIAILWGFYQNWQTVGWHPESIGILEPPLHLQVWKQLEFSTKENNVVVHSVTVPGITLIL